MNIYNILDSRLLLPIAARIQHSNICNEYDNLMRSDWYSEGQLEDLQNTKLQVLIKHCYNNVPYYHHLFCSLNLKPNDILSRNDLFKLPILTKQIINSHYQEFICPTFKMSDLYSEASGGSTGIPLRYFMQKSNWGIKWASTFRAWNWSGFNFGDRILTFGGNSLVKHSNSFHLITKKEIFDRVIMNNYKCDCSDMSSQALYNVYRQICNFEPKALRGYPAAIYNLAKFIEAESLSLPSISMVFTTGEMLLPHYRNLIQKVFKAPIYDGYGASDGGVIAHECYMHNGLHISEEQCVVEITDEYGNLKRPGEQGLVLTTDLDNYAFPFLRYEVGDMAIMKKEKCSCGRSSRMIDQIVGRTGRTLYNKKGEPFTSIVIDNMMFVNMDYHSKSNEDIYLRIEQFQVVQNSKGDINIFLKPKNSNEPISTFEYVVENFRRNFPESIVNLEYVNSIPRMSSGKDEYCISYYTPNK